MIIALAGKAGVGKDTLATFIEENLQEKYCRTRMGFADPVKAMAKSLFDLSDDEISVRELKEKKIERVVMFREMVPGSYSGFNDYLMLALTRAFGQKFETWPRTQAYLVNSLANFLCKHTTIAEKGLVYRKSPRELMQLIGTEWGRNKVGENVWAERLYNRAKEFMDSSECKSDSVVLINDCRFMNESLIVHKGMHAVVVKIERDAPECDNSAHASEEIDVKYDYLIENDGDLSDLEEAAVELLRDLNFIA